MPVDGRLTPGNMYHNQAICQRFTDPRRGWQPDKAETMRVPIKQTKGAASRLDKETTKAPMP